MCLVCTPALANVWFLCCRHVLIKKLSQLRDSEPDLAQLLVDQVRLLERAKSRLRL